MAERDRSRAEGDKLASAVLKYLAGKADEGHLQMAVEKYISNEGWTGPAMSLVKKVKTPSGHRYKVAVPKPIRKGNPRASDSLVSKCQKNWDHYCERPSKKRLKAVMKHCELMAESTAKSVKEERQRCMRAARREAKKLGM